MTARSLAGVRTGLREGTAEDIRFYIDVDLLLDLWDELVLPSSVRRAWASGSYVTVISNLRANAASAPDRVDRRGLAEAQQFALAGGAALIAAATSIV